MNIEYTIHTKFVKPLKVSLASSLLFLILLPPFLLISLSERKDCWFVCLCSSPFFEKLLVSLRLGTWEWSLLTGLNRKNKKFIIRTEFLKPQIIWMGIVQHLCENAYPRPPSIPAASSSPWETLVSAFCKSPDDSHTAKLEEPLPDGHYSTSNRIKKQCHR